MVTLERDTEIQLDEGRFAITERIGNRIHLKNMHTGQTSSLHIGDLLPRLAELPPAPKPSKVLDHLTDADRAEVKMWSTHIEEMTSGFHPEFTEPRTEYDPATTTLNERIASKIAELKAFEIKTSRSSLFEKKKAYEAGGSAALIDGRKHKQVGKLDKADVRVKQAIESVMARRTLLSTVTGSELYRRVDQELTLQHGAQAPPLPSRATIYRYLNAMYAGKQTSSATSRRSRAGTPDRPYSTFRRMLPGQEVQIDTSLLNMYVWTKAGAQRPLLTVMLDVATRTVIAFSLRLVGTKGYDHAQLLGQAMIPFSSRPGLTVQRALVAANDPDLPLLSVEERARLEALHPVIIPRYIITDNGKDYLSDVFRSACAKFNIDLVRSAIHTPTDKSFVERNFGSINDLFSQRHPGYCGRNTEERGLHPEKDDLYDLATAAELLDDWILNVWQYRKHEGLSNPYDPTETYSPNQWFNAAAEFAGAIDLPLTASDFIDLMPSTKRVIGTTGIKHKKRMYDSDELHPHRGMPSNRPHLGNLWEVKFNPRDVSRVWVRSPENTWIECRWRDADSIYLPHFSDISQNLRRIEVDEAADADALRGGAILPGRESTVLVSAPTHAWDPTKHLDLSMVSVEKPNKKDKKKKKKEQSA